MVNRNGRSLRLLALALALTLVAAACGDDDDDVAGGGGGGGGDEQEQPAEGEIDVAEGVTVDTEDCPSGWSDTAGITDTEIRLGISLAESGPFATFGPIDDGMRAYYDYLNENDPIVEGKSIELVGRDDAYDPARTLSNVEEMLQSGDIFAFDHVVGSPQNLAIQDLLNEECVPQMLNATGHPAWGDPENYPWTSGGLLSYNTESQLWCNYVSDELGEGATVAGLFVDNDFGAAYQQVIEDCADEGTIDLVESVTVDPTSPDVTDEITTISASGADVAMLGLSGSFCSQAMAAIAQSSWDPMTLLSNTCQSIATYFTPVDPAGDGVLTLAYVKEIGDPRWADDEAVQLARQILTDAGLDPDRGAAITGVQFGMQTEPFLRAAAEMEGGLTRTNLLKAIWNSDHVDALQFDGMQVKTDGVNDAYMVEGARFAEYTYDEASGEGTYEYVTDLINVEGETGVYDG
ncbi:MAG TPA: ABC transporter substrate-binding protein [Acidimicrobiales bacterium]|nr:ABC transporter substrate-binding protein [Acidimicrobiales bacterium]